MEGTGQTRRLGWLWWMARACWTWGLILVLGVVLACRSLGDWHGQALAGLTVARLGRSRVRGGSGRRCHQPGGDDTLCQKRILNSHQRGSIVVGTVCIRIIFIPVLSLLTLCTATTAHADEKQVRLADILNAVEPRLDYHLSEPELGTATVREDGNSLAFSVTGVTYFGKPPEEYVAGVLQYPEDQAERVARFDKEGTIDPPIFKTQVFCASTTPPYPSSIRVIDERALGVGVMDVLVGDLLGTGTNQIQFKAGCLYAYKDPEETINAERFHMLSLPDLEPLLDVTTLRIIMGMDYVEDGHMYGQQVEIRKASDGAPPRIKLWNAREERVLDLGAPELKALPHSEPWEREEERVAQRLLFSLPKVLRVRVVDEEGEPIVGARVRGNQTKPTRQWETKYYPFEETTDAEGRFSVMVTKRSVGFTVFPKGFYSKGEGFLRTEVPKDEFVLVMEREDPPVLMRSSNSIHQHVWRGDGQRYEIGLQFPVGLDLSEKGAWTENRDEADIWIALDKVGEVSLGQLPDGRNTRAWQATFTGLNGWKIQDGQESKSLGDDIVSVPVDGYQEQVVFQGASDGRRNIYLQHTNGKRFGKLTSVRIGDSSKSSGFVRSVMLRLAIQAEETGIPSLNPSNDFKEIARWEEEYKAAQEASEE